MNASESKPRSAGGRSEHRLGTDLSKYDATIYVETAPEAQEIECPVCGGTFHAWLTEGNIGGGTCDADTDCDAWIRFVYDRSELPENRDDGNEDETEQAGIDGWS